MGLTAQQAHVLRFLRSYISEAGYAPSFAEIGEELGLASKSGVKRLLDGLEERGAIRRLAHRARAIEVSRAANPLAYATDADLIAEMKRRGL